MAGPDGRADWRRSRDLYGQFRAIVDDTEKTNVPPDDLIGALAESWGRTFAHYDRKEMGFAEDLFEVCCQIKSPRGETHAERFKNLYYDKDLNRLKAYVTGEGRRRPKPFEAAVETCRRLRDLNRIRDELTAIESAGILGGSVSYGRFFNTVGSSVENQASDTDILLVIPEYTLLPNVIDAIEKVPGSEIESLTAFRQRLGLFEELRKQKAEIPVIISQKIRLWDPKMDPFLKDLQISGGYKLSVHVFSLDDFNYAILRDKPIIVGDGDGDFSRYIVDYRDSEPFRRDNQRSFSGRDETVELKAGAVKDGHLSKVAVCHIRDRRFYPGLHQNLILPQFEIRWDTLKEKIYLSLLGFRWKILERLTEERRIRPFEYQTLSLSHTRSAHFAPHIVRRANRE